MAWTPSEDITNIYSGPFLVATGAAGSEVSVGEIRDLNVNINYQTADVMGGSFFGTATILDKVTTGVQVSATFGLMQNWGDQTMADPGRVFPLATLSAGPTSKSLTLDVDTICGNILSSSAARWTFHKYSVASLTDYTSDLIFPAGVVIPADESYPIDGEGGAVVQPCVLIAFPDSNKDVFIAGVNAA